MLVYFNTMIENPEPPVLSGHYDIGPGSELRNEGRSINDADWVSLIKNKQLKVPRATVEGADTGAQFSVWPGKDKARQAVVRVGLHSEATAVLHLVRLVE